MRIIQFVDNLNVGGTERMCVNISNALVNDGHEVNIVVARQLGPLAEKFDSRVKIFCLKKKSLFDIIAFVKFIKIILRVKPKFIHAHSTSVYWAIGALAFLLRSCKLIFHDHYGLGDKLRNRDRIILQLLSSRIDFVISVSENLRYWSCINLKLTEDKIRFIRNFPSVDVVNNAEKYDSFNILCLANFRPQKDHFTLVKAIENLLQMVPRFNFKVILAGAHYNDEYWLNVQRMIEEKGLTEYFQISGPVSDVECLLERASVGVLSSISEGLPVSLLEYGLAGLPVVVTNVGQCSEVLENGKFGLLVNEGDSIILAEGIHRLISNYNLAKEMGSNFRSHVIRNYGSEAFLIEYYTFLNVK